MSQPTVPNLKELFKQASEIAQQVPENMQEAAFNRAVDLLTGGVQTETGSKKNSPKPQGRKKASTRTESNEGDSSADILLSAIDSTQHPEVKLATKVLDRSLMVLKISLSDHNIDGLTSSEIAKILTEKFRIGTTYAAVGMALGKATSLVNRIPVGQGYLYKIMAPGEDYLSHLRDVEDSPISSTPQRKSRKKRSVKKGKKVVFSKEVGSKKKTKKVKKHKKKSNKIEGRNTSKKKWDGTKVCDY